MEIPKFLTFEKWLEDRPELLTVQKFAPVECPKCEGAGEMECGECGHEADCDECEGSGEIEFDQSSQNRHERYSFLEAMFEFQKKTDAKKLLPHDPIDHGKT